MLFSSLTFLYIFLPVVIIGNALFLFIKNKKISILCRNIFLLIASIIFYAWGSLYYLAIMLSSIVVNYSMALLIDRFKLNKNLKVFFLVLTIILNIGCLFYFKYFNFFMEMVQAITHAEITVQKVLLPIGISFFTFQALSYVFDVYKGTAKCQKNLLNVALYISFFPQLIAGPIVKYNDVEAQIIDRTQTIEQFTKGFMRFAIGLGKKVLIANLVGQFAEYAFTNIGELSTISAWIGLLCYTLQIFFDFSGYSDMAIGLGAMFGFKFNENFNLPYTALSIQDFWRRWHISLSSWFKEYIYIPLGGSKKGLVRTCINVMIIFLITGIWHGANYTFIIWGVVYGILLVIERLGFGKILSKNPAKFFNWLYTIFCVSMLWVLFRANNLADAGLYYSKLFSFTYDPIFLQQLSIPILVAMVVGILLSGPIQYFGKKIEFSKTPNLTYYLTLVWCVVLIASSIVFLQNESFNPFIYFQF